MKDRFLVDNYAGQIGKGTLFGLNRLSENLHNFYDKYGSNGYILKCDITKFFYSINHDAMKEKIRENFSDKDIQWICDKFIDSVDGDGLPLGNQSSQVFALIYLNGLAGFKAETDKADADAAIAGELQRTIRLQEVAEQQGRVKVVEQEQANLAAVKEKEVIATRAEAEKQKRQIEAEADANVRKVSADATVEVAEKEASATKITAEATAEKTRKEGTAVADVTKQKGIAEAEVIRQRGLAEAEVEKQKLMAQAEGERALAEARASNEKVNFEIEKLKIENEAKITIATKTAEIMANIGQNAEFVNIGGGNTSGGTGNVLIDTLASVPTLMKKLNAENQALNGQSFNDEIRGLVSSIAEPVKGLLATTTNTTVNGVEDENVNSDSVKVSPETSVEVETE